MQTSIENKIKRIKISGNTVAWKLFQIPSLASHYKTFSNLRNEIGLDDLTKGGFLNKLDEVHYKKEMLINSYVTLYPRYNSFSKILKYLCEFQVATLLFFITFQLFLLHEHELLLLVEIFLLLLLLLLV